MSNVVAVVLGSRSDKPQMKGCIDYLSHFGIEYIVKIMSAHRNPDQTATFAKQARKDGFKIIIAAAGMAAHLPGVIAAHTTLPVIGVPLVGSALNGLDALFSIVQMPSGIPVATVAIGSPGAINAAVLALQFLSLTDDKYLATLQKFRKSGAKI